MPNVYLIFLTGLLAGGITCTAVQGGLLAALLIHRNPEEPATGMGKALIVIAFVLSKLVAHTILGFILGFAGGAFQFSIQITSVLLAIASVYMIGLALNILGVHPIFRRFAIATPRGMRQLIWKQSKRGDLFAPIMLGALTVFIPCGVTQAMMVQAIASSSGWAGSLILFSFILGTTPLFLVFGLAISTLSDRYTRVFERVAAVLIIGMAVWNLYNVSAIFGLESRLASAGKGLVCQIQYCDESTSSSAAQAETTTTPIITIRSTKYEISNPNIKRGESITLTVTNKDGGGCIQAFTIPSLGIQKIIPVGKTETFTFTAPQEKGDMLVTCSMGMYRSNFHIL